MGRTNSVHSIGESGKVDRSEDPKEKNGGMFSNQLLPVHVALILMQFGFAGHQALSRVALTSGLSQFVYAIYRNAIALVLMGPFAYALEKKDRPPLTMGLLFRFFLLGFTAIVGSQQLFLAGLVFTSATFATTIQNVIPAITFLMALIFGLEKVRIDRLDGRAKVLGTFVCVSSAVLMSIYKGPAVIKGWYKEDPATDKDVEAMLGQTLGSDKWQLGAILLLINCVSWSAYLIMQAPILKVCPAPLTITSFTYFFGSLQVIFIMFVFTGGKIVWSLSWGPQFFSVIYAGVISSGINFSLQSWAIQKGGPVLVSLYTPVQSIIVAILSVLLLGDSLYLGSVVGGLGAVAGLYLVTWGQVKHWEKDMLEAALSTEGDMEAVITQSFFSSPTSNSSLHHPLLADDAAAGEQQQQQSRHPVVEHAPLAIPPYERRASFYHEEIIASFSPHHVI